MEVIVKYRRAYLCIVATIQYAMLRSIDSINEEAWCRSRTGDAC